MKIKLANKIMAAVLAILCITALAACAKTPSGGEDTTAAPVSSSDIAAPETTSLYEADDLPATLELNETVVMLYNDDYAFVEFFAEEDATDSVEYAIKNRNSAVEKRLGVTVDYVGTPGNYENRAEYEKKVYADFTAGNTYDIYASYSMSVANCAYSGYCADLFQYEVINFEKPWWPEKLTSEASINHKLYMASGDISTNMLYMMYVMYYSKDLITNNNLDDPYALVDAGTWTIDKMIEMAEVMRSDADADSKNYGIATSSNVHYDSFFYGAGLRTLDKDENDQLIISDLFGSEKAINTADKMQDLWNGGLGTREKGGAVFHDGRSLFYVDRASYASSQLGDTDMPFGVIPMPKYSVDQTDYSTCLGFPYTLYAISAGSQHGEAAAYLLEALASEAYRTVTPALFEVSMKVRYVDDPIAARMFDIIRAGVSFDVGRIYTSSLENITYNVFRNAVDGKAAFATTYPRKAPILKGLLKKFNEQFDKISK